VTSRDALELGGEVSGVPRELDRQVVRNRAEICG
jgi:hypothetical protein